MSIKISTQGDDIHLPSMSTPWTEMPIDFLKHVVPNLHWVGWDGCWVWGGSMSNYGLPMAWHINEKGQRASMSLRKAVYNMWRPSFRGRVEMHCGRVNCLNPAHMVPEKKGIRILRK